MFTVNAAALAALNSGCSMRPGGSGLQLRQKFPCDGQRNFLDGFLRGALLTGEFG